jgi:hypothetical protein
VIASPSVLSFAKWLTPKRMRAQAVVLAVCVWGVFAVDFSTAGLHDRAANIKFQDFLPFYISARLIAQHRAAELYDPNTRAQELQSILGQPTPVRLSNLYGPQVDQLFLPLVHLPFLVAARIWTMLSLVLYFVCIYSVWRHLPKLWAFRGLVFIAALAFPPLFHLCARGQISALVLLCFTGALLALRTNRNLAAGVAFGCLILKPQFLVAIPLLLLISASWRILAGLVLSASAQLVFARVYFGSSVMHAYFELFRHPSRWIDVAELSLAPIQMHSLRSFWSLLIPSQSAALVLYLLSSAIALALAASVWRSGSALAIRFAALTFAAVLINPHLFVYDVLVLAPALLMLVDWSLSAEHSSSNPVLHVLLYLAFVLPLLGPLSRWTHVQLSVIAFALILALLYRLSIRTRALASSESLVV